MKFNEKIDLLRKNINKIPLINKIALFRQKRIDTYTRTLYIISIAIFTTGTAYLCLYFNLLATEIPLWSSLQWGIYRISIKNYIFIIPIINLGILILGYYFSRYYSNFNIREMSRFCAWVILFSTIFLQYSLVDIINRSRLNIYAFQPWVYDYLFPFLLAFIISSITAKVVIILADKIKIVEYPELRKEPAQLLTKPTPRGGAIAFFVAFSLVSIMFLGTSQRVLGLIAGTAIATLTGYLDDRFKLNYLPRLLFLLPLAIICVILSGFVMIYIPNPFGEAIKLDMLRINFELWGNRSIIIYAAIAAFIWFMWITNMVSWNNGVDGQFVAITSVATLSIGILSLRFDNLSYESVLSAKLAFISLGAILGLLYFTFPPQKMMWGFGATSVGLVLGALALLSGTRVATAFLVLIIPSIDTLYVLISRILNKKSPFKGDRNHLHHKLLDLGYSKRKIAIIYWLISIACGVGTFLISEQTKALAIATISGLVLYGIIVIRKSAQKISNLERTKL